MHKVLFVVFVISYLTSCRDDIISLYPVSYSKKETFIEKSKKNNKSILVYQEEQIKSYITKRDSLYYKKIGDGFWLASLDSITSEKPFLARVDDEIYYTYCLYNLDDDLIYDSAKIGEKRETLSKANLIRGLYLALQKIEEDKWTSLILPSSLAYGFFGDGDKIKPLTPIVLELKINKIVRYDE